MTLQWLGVCVWMVFASVHYLCFSTQFQKRYSDNWLTDTPLPRKRSRVQCVSQTAVDVDETVENVLHPPVATQDDTVCRTVWVLWLCQLMWSVVGFRTAQWLLFTVCYSAMATLVIQWEINLHCDVDLVLDWRNCQLSMFSPPIVCIRTHLICLQMSHCVFVYGRSSRQWAEQIAQEIYNSSMEVCLFKYWGTLHAKTAFSSKFATFARCWQKVTWWYLAT